jgi:Reverse transcriptase (RNA-dependent DNA polymerase)
MLLGYGHSTRRRISGYPAMTADAAWRRRQQRRQAEEAAEIGALLPFEAVFSTDNLLSTFDRLRVTGGPAPGPDRLLYSISRREAAALCRALSASVLAGKYRPGPERLVRIPKRSGGTRTLRLRSVLDRVVASALTEALTPLTEAAFLPCSYGFRPGRSALHLLADMDAAMTAHDAWVVTEDDISKAFDSVQIDKVLADFEGMISEVDYLNLIGAILRGADTTRKEGICQGCPLSPLALNTHLHFAHDLVLKDRVTIPFAGRYADNLAYLTTNVTEGHQARKRAADRLKPIGMSLKGPGTPTDIRLGKSVNLLGISISARNGTVSYTLADDVLTGLEEALEEAHLASDPPQSARLAVLGWSRAMGPAFESSAATTIPTVLELCTDHGHRGILSKQEILAAWDAGYQSWLSLRKRAFRGYDQ